MKKSKLTMVIYVVAIVIVVVLACILITMKTQKAALDAQRETLIAEVAVLKLEYDALEDKSQYLTTIEALEERARELGMLREGEELWVLLEDKDN